MHDVVLFVEGVHEYITSTISVQKFFRVFVLMLLEYGKILLKIVLNFKAKFKEWLKEKIISSSIDDNAPSS